ncbi:MAG: hypothetical protein IEMM0002_0737 [bacterium]|nr:MAG: hypothetical protein IEMM0002_0737 [bacterium]
MVQIHISPDNWDRLNPTINSAEKNGANFLFPEKRDSKQAVCWALAVSFFYFLPILIAGPRNLGLVDSDYHFYMVEAVRKGIFEYGQLPAWDPWHMGGLPLLGNAQVPLSPLYFPVLLFGTVLGFKITLFILQFIGFTGVYFLARYLRQNHVGGLTSAMIWTLCGLHTAQLQGGWMLFWHLHLIPWIFLLFFHGWKDYRYVVPTSMLLAFLYLGGSPYPYPITMFPLAIFGMVTAFTKKTLRPVVFIAATVLMSVMLCSVKLVSSLAWLADHPRDLRGVLEGYSLTALIMSFLDHRIDLTYYPLGLFDVSDIPFYSGDIPDVGFFYNAPEYGMYMGPIVLLFAAFGMFARFPYKLPILTGFALLTFLIMGVFSPVPIWKALKLFPVYDSIRVVTRFRWPFVLIVSLLAGFGAYRVTAGLRRGPLWQKIILILITVNLYVAAFPLLLEVFPVKSEKILKHIKNPEGEFFQIQETMAYTRQGWTLPYGLSPLIACNRPMLPHILQNVGVNMGYEPFALRVLTTGRGSPKYQGEAFIYTGKNFTQARFTRWTPNRVDIAWDDKLKGTLYLNQNNYEGWEVCDNPGSIIAEPGLVHIPITEKDSTAAFCYRPLGVYIGLVITLLSFAAGIAYMLFAFRKF